MPGSAPAPSVESLANLIEKKGLKFSISTGGHKYICELQDRKTYERKKQERQNSLVSISSDSGSVDESLPTTPSEKGKEVAAQP